MRRGFPVVLVLATLLGGCVGTNSAGGQAQNAAPIGYRYYDSQHPNYVIQPSAEAIANAQRGTYLWPPAMSVVR
ncbi:MAG TPA: hypothetical protein VKQ27_07625 [Acetobacteraceae bacterium]|nr:hypothetical protein [Acetobacteraceae bacterium]